MAINFPASPSTNDTHTENTITWIFNGTSWDAQDVPVTAASIGLGSVDNTSDLDKPISTATQTALDDKQDITDSLTVNNVKSFGAVGDGVTDDTSAIQAAIDDTTNATTYLPRGTYRITSALSITKSGCTLIGDGRKSTIIRQLTSTENGVELQPSTGGQVNSVTISMLSIQGVGKDTSTKTGIYFRHSDDVLGYLSIDGKIDDVSVSGFDTGFYGYWNPLLNLYKLDCVGNDVGCLLEDCDTPSMINCRFKGTDSGSGTQSIALHMISDRAFSAQMINCEHGYCDQVLKMEGGRLLWLGGNVEYCYEDKAIEIKPGATLEMKQVRFLNTDVASPSGSKTLIVADCSSISYNPEIILGDCNFDIHSTWNRMEARGNYAYNFNPRFQGLDSGQSYKIEGSAGSGGSITTLGSTNPFVIWSQQKWRSTVTNTQSGNESRRGELAYFLKNDATADSYNRWEHPVAFYKSRYATFRRGSMLNDRLMEVLTTNTTESATVGTAELLILDHSLPAQTFTSDGEKVVAELFGHFGATANNKTIKIRFGGSTDSYLHFNETGAWNDKEWSLRCVLVRKNYNTINVRTTLLIDGENPLVKHGTSTSHNFATTSKNFDVVAVGVADDDITVRHSEAVWRKNDVED